jgi:hypothetical protein
MALAVRAASFVEIFITQVTETLPEFVQTQFTDSYPVTRHGGAWGEKRCRSFSLLTTALCGDISITPCPGKNTRYPLYRRLRGPQSRSGRRG